MAETLDELNAKIEAIKKKYQPRIDDLTARGKQIQDGFNKPDAVGGAVGADFNVDWKDVVFEFGIPTVSLKDQSISFDVPQVIMTQ